MTAIVKCFYVDTNFGFTCCVDGIHIHDPEVTIIFDSITQTGRTNCDVRHLWIENQVVDYFPKGLAAVFPNLTHITIKNCGLSEISSDDLRGLENIEYLHLENNKLTSLPNDLFFASNRLSEINFDGNKLKYLSSRLLQPVLGSIKVVSFRSNPGIDVFFNEGDRCYEKIDLCKVPKNTKNLK